MLVSPPNCWRGRDDCEPMHAIESFPAEYDDKPDELFEGLDSGAIKPESFVCAGCVRDDARKIPQDAYRVCWKNHVVDEIGEYDEQDLTHQMAVLSQTLAIIASRRVNSGMIEVPTMQASGDKAA